MDLWSKQCQITGNPSTFRSKQYMTVALTVWGSGSHLAIRDAISIASSSLDRWSERVGMLLTIAGIP